MEALVVIGQAALIYALGNFLKHLRNAEWNGVVTQLVIWTAGVAGTFLFAATTFAHGVTIGEFALADFTAIDKVVFGLGAGAQAMAGFDVKRALDNTDSAETPKLIS